MDTENKFIGFLKNQFMLIIALVVAIISCFFVPISADYLTYVDYQTIVCLFAMMLVIAAMKNIKLFRIVASFILNKLGSSRKIAFALVFITFFFSMVIANDMALITFLPFTLMIFNGQKKPFLVAYIIILQNIAANLGGMLTPFGNPQNLYLYSHYAIPTAEFFKVMSVPFCVSIVLLLICCFLVPNRALTPDVNKFSSLPKLKLIVYILTFVFSAMMVFRVVDYRIAGAIILVVIGLCDWRAIFKVDYGLLGVFVCFFIFTGNLAHIPQLTAFFSGLVEKNTLLFSVLSCQFISNVPTAILFSKFAPPEKCYQLLLGVNIGGLGTLIASLASLISFRSYIKEYRGFTLKYIGLYTAANVVFIGILLLSVIFLY